MTTHAKWKTLIIPLCLALSAMAQDDPRGGTKMSFKPPTLDDEAEGSHHVPSALNCEGCKAIAYQVVLGF